MAEILQKADADGLLSSDVNSINLKSRVSTYLGTGHNGGAWKQEMLLNKTR